MKIVVLLLVALIFGGAGMGAGWYLFADHGGEHKEEAAPPPPPPPGPPVFVNIGPLTVPVLGPEKTDQFVTLVVALEVSDLTSAESVRSQAPRLTDAYLTTIYGAIAAGKVMTAGILDVPQVKAKLVAASNKVLGEGMIRDVLIQVVNQRQM